jgi:hypothetical protein
MRTEGAVLRQLSPPGSSSSSQAADEGGLWRVLLKDNRSGHFMQVWRACSLRGFHTQLRASLRNRSTPPHPTPQVGQLRRRPSPSDLEVAFINAKAATSPLTSLVKGVRGLLDAATSKKQA